MGKIVENQEIVPLMGGFGDEDDCAFDQPCKFGYRVDGHSVYCDNKKSPYRKCRCSWYYGRAASIIDKCADEDCEYFKANPNYSEDKKELAKEIEAEKEERRKAKIEYDRLTAEGWLCHRCMNGLPLKDMKVECNMVERNWQEKDNISILQIPDGTEIPWKKECQHFISWEELKGEK
jgi:hypothetical protein